MAETTTMKGKARRANRRSRLDTRAHEILLDTLARSSVAEIVDTLAKIDLQLEAIRLDGCSEHSPRGLRAQYLKQLRTVLSDELVARAS